MRLKESKKEITNSWIYIGQLNPIHKTSSQSSTRTVAITIHKYDVFYAIVWQSMRCTIKSMKNGPVQARPNY